MGIRERKRKSERWEKLEKYRKKIAGKGLEKRNRILDEVWVIERKEIRILKK